MILPIKLVNERLMFTFDFGDKLPWGAVIDRAKIIVETFSGDDPSPQKVFSQTWAIDGTKVTYQVRQGLPGVIYNLKLAARTAGNWEYQEVFMAVAPDSGNVGALYPLTRIFTSLPYPVYITDNFDISFKIEYADTRGIFQLYTCLPEDIDIDFSFDEAFTRAVYYTYFFEDFIDIGIAFVSAETRDIFRTYTALPEGFNMNFSFGAATTARVLITQTQAPEAIDFNLSFDSAFTGT